MNKLQQILIDCNQSIRFHNQSTYCIGTGRMGLALQKAYFDQLKLVQEQIGFSYIRGHGLFSDDMAIYREYKENDEQKIEYNFTYLDMVMDNYKDLKIKPFLELGFMPKKLASGTQTVFYWKGNVTPPSDYEKWCNLVKATLTHLIDRYGREEVLTWPIEVWNEPNLTSFWKDADRQEYMKLYEVTSKAVKEVDEAFIVGGPAICGVDDESWLKDFLDFCNQSDTPIDMITRHAYTTEQPDWSGHYGYQELRAPQVVIDELKVSREIIDGYDRFRGLPMHITEFNTSYIPNCPLHDTNLNAVYIAKLLSQFGDTSASYSYWTFGDIFEEFGVPSSIFHGGFGLVANGLIPKPTFWTFEFFKEIGSDCIHRDDNLIVTKKEDSYYLLAWNIVDQISENNTLDLEVSINLPEGSYSVITKTVDEETCNPVKVWYDLGSPSNPSDLDISIIQQAAYPRLTTSQLTSDKNASLFLHLNRNGMVLVNLRPIQRQIDRGYDPARVPGIL